MIQSIDNKVYSRIVGHGRGWVFTPANFKDLGSRTAVATAIKRYKQNGTIRHIAWGLYDYPRTDPQLGVLTPSVDQIMTALKKRDAMRFQHSGAYAANLLGLSDQVPMKTVFLTDGPTRNLHVGNRQILLKHTSPRNMATAGMISGMVIQALRWLGQNNVDDRVTSILRERLNDKDKAQLMKDIRYTPIWITKIIHTIAGEDRS